MEQPLVSVILPTYNRAEYLPRAMESVLSQSYKNLELIVVDDGSTDNTREVVNAYQDTRIRYMRTPSNRGVAAARNAGIRRASGEYIAFQDSDDKWLPGKLEKQVRALTQAEPDVGMVYHIMSRKYENGETRYIPDAKVPQSRRSGQIFENLLTENIIGAPTLCVRKSVLTGENGVGVFDTQMPNLEDYELILRIAARYNIAYIDEVLIDTFHLQDGTNGNLLHGIISHCMIIRKYQQEMQKHGIYERRLQRLRDIGKMMQAEETVNKIIQQYCGDI